MTIGQETPYLGYDSAIGVAKEVAYGTFVTSTSHIEFTTEATRKNREEIKIPSINTTRDITKRLVGNETVEGSIEADIDVFSDGIVNIIKQAMGGTVSSAIEVTAASQYLHTLNTGDMESNKSTSTASDMKALSIAVRKGSTYTWDYSGVRVNNLTIKGEIGTPVNMSIEFIGKEASITTTMPTVSLSDYNPCNFTGITIQTGDSITNLGTECFTGFEFTLNNNLDGDQRCLGSRNIAVLPPLKREVSLKLMQRFDTNTAYETYIENTLTAIQIYCDSEQTVGSTGTTGALIIKVPEGYYNSNMPEVGGPDVLTHELEITGIYNSTQGASVIMQVRNNTASYE
jgi:hypothetical protein